MAITRLLIFPMVCFLPLAAVPARAQDAQDGQEETYPAPAGNEQNKMYVNPNSGAAVIVPGEDLQRGTMPTGPQTEQNFPEPPPANESNTTVIVQPNEPPPSSSSADGGNAGQ